MKLHELDANGAATILAKPQAQLKQAAGISDQQRRQQIAGEIANDEKSPDPDDKQVANITKQMATLQQMLNAARQRQAQKRAAAARKPGGAQPTANPTTGVG